MATNNIVSLAAFRELKKAQDEELLAYQALILSMDKLELLDEMVRFQQERTREGKLTIKMMLQGKVLFKALERNAETQELKILSRSYRRHLEYELAEYTKKADQQTADQNGRTPSLTTDLPKIELGELELEDPEINHDSE